MLKLIEHYYEENGVSKVEMQIEENGSTIEEPEVYNLDSATDMAAYFTVRDAHFSTDIKRPEKYR